MLTTPETLKAELGIGDASQDSYLDTLIKQASAAVETFCGRTFAVTPGSQTFRLTSCRERLVLERVPVTEVAEVTVDGTALVAGEWEIEDARAGFLLRVDGSGKVQPWFPGKVVVNYSAGFATIPTDVERACLDLCVRAYYAKQRGDPALRTESTPDVGQMGYALPGVVGGETLVEGLPASVAGRLASYVLRSFA